MPLETKYDRSFEKENLDGSREDSENAKSWQTDDEQPATRKIHLNF